MRFADGRASMLTPFEVAHSHPVSIDAAKIE
jgi:hypothetical protein